ncbi:MAG TPA: LysR family transcriptional regulator [Anaeromyxobacter sp.]
MLVEERAAEPVRVEEALRPHEFPDGVSAHGESMPAPPPPWNARLRIATLAEMHASLDWNDLRYLLAAEQTGSHAAAARRLRVDQATVGRRLRALQEAIGTPLLERTPGRLSLTEAGRRALHAAQEMDQAALHLERSVTAGIPEVAGLLRITATDALASRILAPRLADLTSRHPGLTVELLGTNQTMSLSRREADVAVRLYRPVEPAVAARRVGTLAFALYASRDYLRRRGRPDTMLRGHDLLGYDRPLAASSEALGWVDEFPGARVVLRTNGALSVLAATLAGLGMGVLPCFLADSERALVRALPQLRTREIWLAVHGDLRRSARTRVGLDFVAGVLSAEGPRLRGDSARHPPLGRRIRRTKAPHAAPGGAPRLVRPEGRFRRRITS